MKDFDIVISIITYNSDLENLKKLIESINQFKNIRIQTIVADNNSDNNYFNELLKLNTNVISLGKNYGYGKANNIVNKISAKSKYFLVLNPDIYFKSDTLDQIYNFMEKNNNFSLISPLLVSNDGMYYNIFRENYSFLNLIYRRLFKINDKINKKDFEKTIIKYNDLIDIKYISGSFMFFRREHFNMIKGFNKKFFMYFEDVEICDYLRSREFKIGILKNTMALHLRERGSYKKIKLLFYHFLSALIYKIYKRK